jgi:hypothetical protein
LLTYIGIFIQSIYLVRMVTFFSLMETGDVLNVNVFFPERVNVMHVLLRLLVVSPCVAWEITPVLEVEAIITVVTHGQRGSPN